MKKKAALFCLAVILGCATISTPPPQEPIKNLNLNLPPYSGLPRLIAVIDLRNQSEFDDPRIGRGISKMLITALVNSGRFTVVERQEAVLDRILREQGLSLMGVIDPTSAAQVGRLLGAKAVVVGEVSEFGIRKTGGYIGLGGTKTITTRVVIDARMIDVTTGQILVAETGVGTSSTQTSGVALTFEFGTAGFDETTIGIATRIAVNKIVKGFAEAVDTQKF
ncbi:MAG: CsgG/HfaB family protein [Candidatus Edwardsbacteria bacterium]